MESTINKIHFNYSNAPKFIYDFENKHIEEILSLNYGDYNIWQINKINIFYYLLSNDNGEIDIKRENFYTKSLAKLHFYLTGFLNFLKLVLYNFNSNPQFLVVTNSIDRLTIKKGKYFSPLFDPLILLTKRTAHWEYIGNSTKPLYTKPKNDLTNIESLAFKGLKNKKFNTNDIDKFLELWSNFCLENNVKNDVNRAFILNNCIFFLKQLTLWKYIFKLVKPKNIFSSEKVGTGFMAAANCLKIPIYEFQHGSIDKHYPPYVWNSSFNKIINPIKPNYLIVFGNFAMEIISKSNYFSEKQIHPVGYSKIDQYRKLKVDSIGTVFFALQPMMHEFNIEIIGTILTLSTQFPISIKYHPLQNKEEVNCYNSMLKDSKVKIYNTEKSIYDCILESEITISHVSTVLEEALSLGKVSITIATKELPYGIHCMTGSKKLIEVIIPKRLDEINEYLNSFFTDLDFKKNEKSRATYLKAFIYENDYENNLLNILENA